ncbi:hypothetical protein Tco_0974325 [Tanacetum coccineum]|uniref:Uncharacterized protein n=1 Tax=Tanacetum coccineum TaxID=301880 RepID=A0ABQ5EB92_9ASTR
MNRYGYSSVGRFDVFFRNQLLVFQQHQDESLYDSWTRFKDIIRKVPNHVLNIWTLIEIFLKYLDSLSCHIINLSAEGDLRKFSDIGAWDDMVKVQVPRCMAWLDYDEHVDSLSTMDNEVGVTSPESTTQTLPSFEEYYTRDSGKGRISKNPLDKVLQLHYPFLLPERLKADNTDLTSHLPQSLFDVGSGRISIVIVST